MRKPLPPTIVAPPPSSQAADSGSTDNSLPYPVTPTSPDRTPRHASFDDAVAAQRRRLSPSATQARSRSASASGSDTAGTTDRESDTSSQRGGRGELPDTLRAGAGRRSEERLREEEAVPAALRVGPPGGSPRSSYEGSRPSSANSQRPLRRPGSPYLRPLVTGQDDTASNAAAGSSNPKTLPSVLQPGSSLSSTFDDHGRSKPPVAMTANLPIQTRNQPQVPPKDTYYDPSTANKASGASSGQTVHRTESTLSADSEDACLTASSLGWDPGADISTFDGLTSRSHGLPEGDARPQFRTWEQQKEWEKNERIRKELELAAAVERAQREEAERRAEEEWHRGEEEARKAEREQAQKVAGHSSSTATSRSTAEQQQPRAQKQTNETYQVKHIHWVDTSQSTSPRKSPILVQNANGPCPLLALVNALTLSTPPNITSGLVETLRVREQVSLGLLLDAVFDELMSGRRGNAAQELPDVGELYQFLVTLHTGMNVNPKFTPPSSIPTNLMDMPPGTSPRPRTETASDLKPGAFEETKEMRLYSTFSVPLIHGWLPPKSHPAYLALSRSGKTYEDAQNILFREEELEEKLNRAGLAPEEQQLLQDVTTIKYFLSQSATQLTRHGLKMMVETMSSGSIAILFRNDHFSTLYKHPQSHKLMQLVTDMGYAGHDEVVWESLVDTTGEGCEFYSGDFRPVGSTADEPAQGRSRSRNQQQGGWTTVENRHSRTPNAAPRLNTSHSGGRQNPQEAAGSPRSAEQEDHDLALALQLQEEEEDRHRRDVEARRRREESLSHDYLSQQEVTEPRPRGRRSVAQGQQIRPLVPPRGERQQNAAAGNGPPPPSYQQSASDVPYHPSMEALPRSQRPGAVARNSGAHAQNSSVWASTSEQVTGHGGRRPARPDGTGQSGRDSVVPSQAARRRQSGAPTLGPPQAVGNGPGDGKKECIVM
ncbi:MAG: hypothetical protein M1833_003349 [Piccolia ochrophora]|nr:MAG: hypothetical protein M1833_003349 [Piccolia ochrophora]